MADGKTVYPDRCERHKHSKVTPMCQGCIKASQQSQPSAAAAQQAPQQHQAQQQVVAQAPAQFAAPQQVAEQSSSSFAAEPLEQHPVVMALPVDAPVATADAAAAAGADDDGGDPRKCARHRHQTVNVMCARCIAASDAYAAAQAAAAAPKSGAAAPAAAEAQAKPKDPTRCAAHQTVRGVKCAACVLASQAHAATQPPSAAQQAFAAAPATRLTAAQCTDCAGRHMEQAFGVACRDCGADTWHNRKRCETCAAAQGSCAFCGRAFANAAAAAGAAATAKK